MQATTANYVLVRRLYLYLKFFFLFSFHVIPRYVVEERLLCSTPVDWLSIPYPTITEVGVSETVVKAILLYNDMCTVLSVPMIYAPGI